MRISIANLSLSIHDGPPRTRFGASGRWPGGTRIVLARSLLGKLPPPQAFSINSSSVTQPHDTYPGLML
jgi:hypothetical protein